jgi:hypothetical protein
MVGPPHSPHPSIRHSHKCFCKAILLLLFYSIFSLEWIWKGRNRHSATLLRVNGKLLKQKTCLQGQQWIYLYEVNSRRQITNIKTVNVYKTKSLVMIGTTAPREALIPKGFGWRSSFELIVDSKTTKADFMFWSCHTERFETVPDILWQTQILLRQP